MSLKPPVPHIITSHSLAGGLLAVAPLYEGSGPPNDLISGTPVASTFTSGTGVTWSDPVWVSDATYGAGLQFSYVPATSYTRAAQFPIYHATVVSGTIACVARRDVISGNSARACFFNSGSSTNGYGDATLGCLADGTFLAYLRGGPVYGATPIALTLGKIYALAMTFDVSTGLVTLYAKNLTDNTSVQTSSQTQSLVNFSQIHSLDQTWAFGYPGTSLAGNFTVWTGEWGSTIWSPANFDTFAADPYGVVRPTLAVLPTSVAAGVSNQAFTLTSNVGTYTNGSPGSPVITATGATLNTPQTVSGGKTVSLSVVSTGSNGGTITFTDPTYQVNASVSVTSASATDFTITPPSPATGDLGVTSGNFTLTPNGLYTGTATLSDGGAGGTFSPSSLSWSGESSGKTFTYTPIGFAQAVTVSAALSGLGSHATTYTSQAVALSGGWIARQSGTLTSLTFDGDSNYGADNVDTPTQPGGTVASGGQGTLTYAWFLLPRPDTALVGDPGTLIAGQTGADLTLTDLTRFTRFIVVRRVTDGAGATAWSNVVVASTLCDFTVSAVVCGDSITAMMDKTEFKSQLQGSSNTEHIQYTFDGADKWCAGKSGSSTRDWVPDAVTPTITGSDSVARNLLLNACYVASTISADVHVMMHMIGVNDAIHLGTVPPATYKSAVQEMIAYALSHGFDFVVLDHPTDVIAGPSATPTMRAALIDYCDAMDSLDNGVTVFTTGNKTDLAMAGRVDRHDNGSGSITDPIHFNAAGFRSLSRIRANSLTVALDRYIKSSGSSTSSGGGGCVIGSPIIRPMHGGY
jgi:hypothetical protein